MKDERLLVRMDPREKRLLERAAEAAHQDVSAFMLHAATLRAEQVLAERSVIRLSPRAGEALSEALAQPARVNERLAVALKRPQKFRWID